MRRTFTIFLLVTLGFLLLFSVPWIVGFTFIRGPELPIKLIAGVIPTTPFFDSRRFVSKDLKYRYTVLDDTVNNRLKPGMSEEAVKSLLGAPDAILPSGEWQYESREPGWRLIDWNGGGIRISFSPEHTLVTAEKNHWTD